MNNNQTTQADEILKLKDCPFCPEGGEPYIDTIGNDFSKQRYAEIGCKKCRFKMRVGVIRQSLEWAAKKAVEQWNTRTNTHLQVRLKQADLLVTALEKIEYWLTTADSQGEIDGALTVAVEALANYQANKEQTNE